MNTYEKTKLFIEGWNGIENKERPDRLRMMGTPEMLKSVEAFIEAKRRVKEWTLLNDREILLIQLAKMCMRAFLFFVISPGQCKSSYSKRNGENHRSVLLGIGASSPLQIRSGPLWFLIIWSPLRISIWYKVFKKDTVSKCLKGFPSKRNTKAYFPKAKMIFKNRNWIEK